MGSKVAKSPAIAEDAGGRVTTALKPSVFGSGNPQAVPNRPAGFRSEGGDAKWNRWNRQSSR